MNSDDFEQQLQHRRQRPLPADWREEILRVAYMERAEFAAQTKVQQQRFTARQIQWSALAAVWVLIGYFHFTDPATESAMLAVAPRSSNSESPWHEQQRLIAELLAPVPVEPQPLPPPPQPRSGNRTRSDQSVIYI
ncbi:hypothetical protein ACXR0O_11730 [Verrucomicrobiota bacterium sgz303538]